VQGKAQRIRTRSRGRDQLERRTAQAVGAVGFLLAALLPFLLWRRAMAIIASDFRLELDYLVTGWTAYGLIVLGLLFAVPVLFSIGRSPSSRLYPRSRQAYAGWAAVLYLLGVLLASQVAQIADGPADA
jgi:hypothetical protein